MKSRVNSLAAKGENPRPSNAVNDIPCVSVFPDDEAPSSDAYAEDC